MISDLLKQLALDAINIPIFVLDRDLRIVVCNRALRDACRFHGIDPEVIGRPYDQAFPFLLDGTEGRYQRLFTTGETEITQHTVNISNRSITFEVMRFPVAENSVITHIVVVGRDITESKNLEQSLRESEETTRVLLNASSASMVLIDSDCRIITSNEMAAARLNRTAAELVGRRGEDLFPPDLWKTRQAHLREVIESGRSLRFQDCRAGRTMDIALFPILDSDQKVHRIAINVDDVTERESALTAIRDNEATARALMNSSTESMLLIDVSGRIITLNETAAARMGATVSELVGQMAQDIFSTEIWGPRQAGIRKIVETGRPLRFLDKRRDRTLDATIQPVFDEKGQVIRVAVFARDITEQELTNAALRESEEIARTLMNASSESIILMDADETIVALNEVAAARVGLSVAEAVGRKVSTIFAPEVSARRRPYAEAALKSRAPVQFADSRGGRSFDISLHPILGGDGEVRRIAAFARDITEYQEAMSALRESEERYRRQFESIPVPTFVWEQIDHDFVLRRYNRAAETMTLGKVVEFVGRLASEMYAERPDIVNDMIFCAETGEPIVREMMYHYQATTMEKYVRAHFGFVPPNQVVVHAIDETERRQTEVALQVAHRTLEGEVERRTQQLAQANEQLNVEREALRHKNIALQQVIEQASRSKDSLAEQIQANIDRIILPVLDSLTPHLDSAGTKYLTLARTSLQDIVSPYVRTLETRSRKLTSREIELCNLIRQGQSTKEIAGFRNTSVQTVLTQRKIIRRKLGILGKQVNLASYLMSIGSDREVHDE